MRKWHIPYIVGIVVLMVVAFAFIAYPIAQKANVTYQGKEVFRTEADYSQFKEAIGAEGIVIIDTDVLSSESPIVVQFSASIPPDMQFNYGEVIEGKGYHLFLAGYITLAIFGLFGIFLPLLITWQSKPKSKKPRCL